MSKASRATSTTSNSNWSSQDITFQQKRDEMLSNLSPNEIAGAPFVYIDRQTLTTSLTRIHLFEKIIDVQGAVVECGVHRANSLFLYYHLSTILEPFNFNRKIIGFDTFEGFRSLSKKDLVQLSEGDFSDTNLDLLQQWADLQDENRAVPHIPKIELVKGDATLTIPKYVEENPHLIIAMLYLDFDIYAPTAAALKYLLPLVPKGGIVGLDEINCKKWQGETIALKEYTEIGNVRLKKFYYDPWVSYYFVE